MTKIKKWAKNHGISDIAINELSDIFGLNVSVVNPNLNLDTYIAKSEAAVQVECRLKACKLNARLWRNNVGVAQRADDVPIRFGLCNETKQMNKNIKSSDLIGIRSILITHEHVGTIIGQFFSREVKESDWKFTGSPREQAQLRFHNLVTELGGDSKFINNAEDLI